jgi:hypothetical protein
MGFLNDRFEKSKSKLANDPISKGITGELAGLVSGFLNIPNKLKSAIGLKDPGYLIPKSTPKITPSPTPTVTPSPTVTPRPTITPTATPFPTVTSRPTATPTIKPTPVVTKSPSIGTRITPMPTIGKSQAVNLNSPGISFPGRPTVTPTPTPIPEPTAPPHKAAMPYYKQINMSAKANNIPESILYEMLRKESMTFNPKVISGQISSPVGAQGIAQFMPSTAKGMKLNPLDPKEAISAAAEYLANKYKEFGDWPLALAAYNAGSGAVRKYSGIPPYKETQDYVSDILKRAGVQ